MEDREIKRRKLQEEKDSKIAIIQALAALVVLEGGGDIKFKSAKKEVNI